jgi:bifunctional aspartokinase / homoserine dehydrogenase 1
MEKTLVMKFGGTSVGDADAIHQAAAIIISARKDWDHIAVVVSAMSGVTDMLLAGAHAAIDGEIKRADEIASQIQKKHRTAIKKLLAKSPEKSYAKEKIAVHLDEFRALCHAVSTLGELSLRALDAISSLGEKMSIALVCAHLRESGCAAEAVSATELIRTDDTFQAAYPDMIVTRQLSRARLFPLFKEQNIPVVTGFIGSTADGVTTTLGRGGSDFSAAILGTALDAGEVWIWTDVDGVMTTDPRVAPTARTLKTVTYREVSELAYFGAKVLHPKTIRPVVEKGIPLWIKNTFNPNGPATQVVPDNGANNGKGKLRAVTAIKNLCMITIEGRGMVGVQGIAARAFGAVASTETSVSLISQASSEQSICFTIPSSTNRSVLGSLEDEFQVELAHRDIDNIAAMDDVVIVTVVGAGMRHTPGIAGAIFSVLGEQSINIIAIAQGSSEVSISLVVAASDADGAIGAIHDLIIR